MYKCLLLWITDRMRAMYSQLCGHIDVCDEPIKNAGYLIFYGGVLDRSVYSTSNSPEKE
jgi:hypothetical protein